MLGYTMTLSYNDIKWESLTSSSPYKFKLPDYVDYIISLCSGEFSLNFFFDKASKIITINHTMGLTELLTVTFHSKQLDREFKIEQIINK